MRDAIIIATSFFLCGGLVGWILGNAAGFLDGVEHERQQVENARRNSGA